MATLRKNASGSLLKKSGTLAIGKCEECSTECENCKWSCIDCVNCNPCIPLGREPGCSPGEETCCTPSFYEVIVEGIVAPPETCLQCDSGSITEFSGHEVNGTFILPYVGLCQWEKNLGAVTWKAYSDAACADNEVTVTGQLFIILSKTEDGYRFEIEGRDFNDHGETGAPYGNVTAYVQPDTGGNSLPHDETGVCSETLESTGQIWNTVEREGLDPVSPYCKGTGVGSFEGGAFEVDYDDSDATAEIVPCGKEEGTVEELLGPCGGGVDIAGCSAEGEACCTPNSMEIVFSGVDGAGCSGCRDVGGTYLKNGYIRLMNGAHDLTQTPLAPYCTWTKTIGSETIDGVTYWPHQYDSYSDAGCSSLTSSGVTESVLITLTKTSDSWTLTAKGTTTNGKIFEGSVLSTSLQECMAVSSIDNDLVCTPSYDPTDTSDLNEGGTATGSAC